MKEVKSRSLSEPQTDLEGMLHFWDYLSMDSAADRLLKAKISSVETWSAVNTKLNPVFPPAGPAWKQTVYRGREHHITPSLLLNTYVTPGMNQVFSVYKKVLGLNLGHLHSVSEAIKAQQKYDRDSRPKVFSSHSRSNNKFRIHYWLLGSIAISWCSVFYFHYHNVIVFKEHTNTIVTLSQRFTVFSIPSVSNRYAVSMRIFRNGINYGTARQPINCTPHVGGA